jgi:YggT family protein
MVKRNAAERRLLAGAWRGSSWHNRLWFAPEIALTSPLALLFNIVWFVILAHVIMSWLINFQVLNLRQPQVAQIWGLLNRMLEPIYRPIRRMLPPMGGLDLAPLIAIILLIVLGDVLTRYTGLM